MSRPLRLDAPGESFHVLARGNARAPIFRDDEDRASFLEVLAGVVDTLGVACHAYGLMDNHYHLILQPNAASLSTGMQRLNGVFTQRLNRRHRRTGHLFEGRFKSLLIDRDVYLLELSRYIVLNPVRAGLVSSPEAWPWSSYRAMIGLAPSPTFLTEAVVLRPLGDRVDRAARATFAAFVLDGIGDAVTARRLAAAIETGVIAGPEALVQRFEPALRAARDTAEIPLSQRLIGRPRLERLLAGLRTLADLRLAIARAHLEYRYPIEDIATRTALSRSTVSRIVRRARRARESPLPGLSSLEE
jgi:putative transposase